MDVEGRYAKFQDTLDTIFGQTKKTADRMAQAFDVVKGALATLGVGVSVAGFAALVKSAIDVQDRMLDMSKATGVSIQQLDQMRQAAQLAGTNFDDVGQAMAKLARNMSSSGDEALTASGAFKFLGISAKDSEGNFRGVGDVMVEIAKKLETYKDGVGKTALVQDLLGKNTAALIPYLHDLAEADDRASTMTQQSAEAAHRFEIALRELNISMEKSRQAAANELVPALTKILDIFSELRAQQSGNTGFFSALGTVLQYAAAAAGSFWLALKDMGDGIGAFAAQTAALATFDLKAYREIGKARDEEFKKNEQQFNDFQKRMLAAPEIKLPSADGDPRKNANYNRKDPRTSTREADAEQRLFITTLQRLENEFGKLNGQTELQKIKYEELKGSLQTLTPAHRRLIEEVAHNIDVWRQEEVARAEVTKGWDVYAAEIDKAQAALQSFNDTQRADQLAQQFSLDLIGKSAAEQARMTELRKIDLEFQRAGALIPEGQIDKLTQLREAYQKTRTAGGEAFDAIREKSRRAFTGATDAINEYIDAATNSAAQTKTLFADAFKGMEDALVSFVKTGKLDFKSLADTVITQLIRIQVQRSLVEPLSKLLNFGGLFSGNTSGGAEYLSGPRAAGGPVLGGNSYLVGERGPEIFMPRTSGTIIPHGAGGWGGDVNISFSGGEPTDPQSFLATVIPIIKSVSRGEARSEIGTQLRNGGVLA